MTILIFIAAVTGGCGQKEGGFSSEAVSTARANALANIQEFEAKTLQQKAAFMAERGHMQVLNQIRISGDASLKKRFVKDLNDAKSLRTPVSGGDPRAAQRRIDETEGSPRDGG